MIDANKFLLASLVTFILLTALTAPVASKQPSASTAAPTANAGGAPATDKPESSDKPQTANDPDAIVFSCKCIQGDTIYYVIENEYRENGGVPPLLSYSTTIKDRRTIQQKVLPQSLRQPTSASVKDNLVTLLWKVERYEVAEQGMKDTVTYDSVRHLYPPSSIWELGGIAGSKTTFYLDPVTCKSEGHLITPNKTSGESTRRPLSKIASKCQLTNQNLQSLLNDLGPYWMPETPVREGESWTKNLSEEVRTFGTLKTLLTCKLKSVRKSGDRRIATVELSGDLTLIPATQPAPASRPATTQEGQKPLSPRQQEKEFSLDKGICKGTVEFDVDHGDLVSMNLHREANFVAKITSEKSGPMELRSGSSHILKVKSGKTAPPKPIIVGGPKPPESPPEEKPPVQRRTPTTRPSIPRPPVTTRPHASTTRPSTVTTRPAGLQGETGVAPTTQPANRRR